MDLTYPEAIRWYAQQTKPIYLQSFTPSIPFSLTFPREDIQQYFSTDGTPFKYFVGTASWLMALAIMEGFKRIELWGFHLGPKYHYERPCFFYWLDEARRRGIDAYLPPDVEISPAGDPTTYSGPLYGYEPHSPSYMRTF